MIVSKGRRGFFLTSVGNLMMRKISTIATQLR